MEEKKKKLSAKALAGIIVIAVAVVAAATMGVVYAVNRDGGIEYVKAENSYRFTNPEALHAAADDGFAIDGVFDEQAYKDNTWLYLREDNGNATVDLALTSYYGENGVYFAFDNTESTPIYVNPNRPSYLNSGIELYLAPDGVTSMNSEDIFEIDLLPTGEVSFKKRMGNNSFVNAASGSDIMACLGTALKGGTVNTEECYGYTLEFFIPWDYLEHLGLDPETVKKSHFWVNPAHITSYNYGGTDLSVDRYWFPFATQKGGDGWGDVTKYFRFNGDGAMDTVPVTLVEGEHYTITGSRSVITNMKAYVTITPEKGYAISSVLCNGEERIKKVSWNEDGSVNAVFKGPEYPNGLTISAAAEKVTEGPKVLSGQVNLKQPGGGNVEDLWIACIGPKGETQITLDENNQFVLKDLEQGFYTIQAEKKGFYKFSKGIYLNRNIETDVDMEYEMFAVESGTSWDLDGQNDMELFQWGGRGAILSVNSYDNFFMEGNFWYDPEQPTIAKDDDHVQQRTGFRVKFDNGMYLNPDLLYENGIVKIQYGKIMDDKSLFNWNTVYTLTESEIAKYKSRGGIRFGLMRDGQYVLLYLDGKVVRIDDLGDEYKSCKAQAGFESFSTASYTIKYKFDYLGVKAPDELIHATNLEEGRIALPFGGTGEFQLPGKYTSMNLVLKAMDHPDGQGDPRTDVLLNFDNGKAISFGIAANLEGNIVVQSTDAGLNAWKAYGELTAEEVAQYRTTAGVLFRVVRDGTDFYLYVGDRLVSVVDLTGSIEPETEMTVTIRHWDDMGAWIDIPFDISRDVNQGLSFFLHGLEWETVGTERGVLTSKPWRDDTITELRIRKRFVDIDLTLTMKETNYPNENRNDIFFQFTGGKTLSFGINSLRDGGGVRIQSTDDSIFGWDVHSTLSSEKAEKFRKEGVDLRVVRKGTMFYLLLDGRMVNSYDLSSYIGADEEASVSIRYWGDGGERHEIPFVLSDTVTDKTIDDLVNHTGIFVDNLSWDLSRETEGIVSIPDGGEAGHLQFRKKFTDMDLTLKVQDHPDGRGEPRTAVYVTFDNGEEVRFSVVNQGRPFVQTMDGTLFVWNGWGDLTAEEAAQYQTAEGIDYRIVRKGTVFYQFIGDRLVATHDLSDHIKADTAATVSIWHWGDEGVRINIPFVSQDSVADTKVTIDGAENGSVTSEKRVYSFGESIVLNILPDKEYRLKKLTVNGEDRTAEVVKNKLSLTASGEDLHVTAEFERPEFAEVSFQVTGYKLGRAVSLAGEELSFTNNGATVKAVVGNDGMVNAKLSLGTYKLSAEKYLESTIQVEASGIVEDVTLAYDLFRIDAGSWDLSRQNDGVVTVNNGDGNICFTDKRKDMDLTVKVQDHPNGTGEPRTGIFVTFDNGQQIRFSVVNQGRPFVQTMDGTLLQWNGWGDLTAEETALYQTAEGIDYRIVREGTFFYQYIGDRLVATHDLSAYIAADTAATVSIWHWGDMGVNIDIPFELQETGPITVGDLNLNDTWQNLYESADETCAVLSGTLKKPSGNFKDPNGWPLIGIRVTDRATAEGWEWKDAFQILYHDNKGLSVKAPDDSNCNQEFNGVWVDKEIYVDQWDPNPLNPLLTEEGLPFKVIRLDNMVYFLIKAGDSYEVLYRMGLPSKEAATVFALRTEGISGDESVRLENAAIVYGKEAAQKELDAAEGGEEEGPITVGDLNLNDTWQNLYESADETCAVLSGTLKKPSGNFKDPNGWPLIGIRVTDRAATEGWEWKDAFQILYHDNKGLSVKAPDDSNCNQEFNGVWVDKEIYVDQWDPNPLNPLLTEEGLPFKVIRLDNMVYFLIKAGDSYEVLYRMGLPSKEAATVFALRTEGISGDESVRLENAVIVYGREAAQKELDATVQEGSNETGAALTGTLAKKVGQVLAQIVSLNSEMALQKAMAVKSTGICSASRPRYYN